MWKKSDPSSFIYRGQANTMIYRATIIPPDREPIPDGYVAIRAGKIHDVGIWSDAIQVPPVRGKRRRAAAVEIVDLRGKFIIPGLIDGHVHLNSVPGLPTVLDQLDSTQRSRLEKIVTDYRNQVLRSYLYFGYTALVDLNVTDRAAQETLRAQSPRPDLFDCDGGVPIANGYPMRFLPDALRFQQYPNFLYDARQPTALPATAQVAAHTPEAVVDRIRNHGAICVKTYYEDGFGPQQNDWPTPTPALLQALVAHAHRHQLVTFLHANALAAQEVGVTNGIDVLAHGLWHWESEGNQIADNPTVQTLLDRIIAQQTGYMPTFQVLGGLQALLDPSYWEQPQIRHVIPPNMLTWFQSADGQALADTFRQEELGTTTGSPALLDPPLQRLAAVVKYLADRHARLLFGTDTPSAPVYGNLPGLNGYLEMRRWAAAGVPLATILRAATIENATHLHLQGHGTIAAGKLANLLILDANPLQNIEAYDAIAGAILHGRYYSRADFSAARH
ncbi:MAG: amidohydrolase family protein [Deltaproteobacteria bacterium]|nr:amidohydrolase family protein [Deltaproteobacteria bacterium]